MSCLRVRQRERRAVKYKRPLNFVTWLPTPARESGRKAVCVHRQASQNRDPVHNVYRVATLQGLPDIPQAGFPICKMDSFSQIPSRRFLRTRIASWKSGEEALWGLCPPSLRFLCFPLLARSFTLRSCQLPPHRFPSRVIQSLDFIRKTPGSCVPAGQPDRRAGAGRRAFSVGPGFWGSLCDLEQTLWPRRSPLVCSQTPVAFSLPSLAC